MTKTKPQWILIQNMQTKLLVDFVGSHLYVHLNNFFNSMKVCNRTQ